MAIEGNDKEIVKGVAKADAPKADAPKADAPKADAPKADAPKADAPKADAPKAEETKATTEEALKASVSGATDGEGNVLEPTNSIGTEDLKDDETLLGSSIHNATYTLKTGDVISLGDLVREARELSSLSSNKEWNDLSEEDRNERIQQVLEGKELEDTSDKEVDSLEEVAEPIVENPKLLKLLEQRKNPHVQNAGKDFNQLLAERRGERAPSTFEEILKSRQNN